MEWFANKGQVVQVIAAIVCGLAACAALIVVLLTNLKVAVIFTVVVTWSWAVFSIVTFVRDVRQRSKKAAPESETINPEILLTVQDVVFPLERPSAPHVGYKSKVRIVLKNESGGDIDVLTPTWIRATGDASIQPLEKGKTYMWQIEGPAGWETSSPASWLPEELSEIHLRHGDVCRTWIALAVSLSDDEARRRHETRRLGTLALTVKVGGIIKYQTLRL